MSLQESPLNSLKVSDAFDSMLRTDYIPLRDTDKLGLLAEYFVDYLGYLPELLGSTDQLIVGRRGTGKTTLLYRALVECMKSWEPEYQGPARLRTLGVYLDLDKCNSLAGAADDYERFERAFVSELCDAITEELHRSWPALKNEPGLLSKIFRPRGARRQADVRAELERLVHVLTTGLPRFVDKSAPVQITRSNRQKASTTSGVELSVPASGNVDAGASAGTAEEHEEFVETVRTETTNYQLSILDLMRVISDLRAAAEIPNFIIFIDEFSALGQDHQLRFTTLLKRLLGNHAGVVVKLCAITDNYTLGSSLILQRDLFELSLDLNSFVERHGTLTGAMTELEQLTEKIVTQRLSVYGAAAPSALFDSPSDAYTELTRAAMGVPRTIGIVLKQALSRAKQGSRPRIRRGDLDYGIRYASRAYLNQMIGASKNGFAIPEHVATIWSELVGRASDERAKSAAPASHFMALQKHDEKLRYLNMFFLVHLIEEGRTTKKESRSRHLYAFDYGLALDNNLGWGDDKNVIRQQRFVYDDVLELFDSYYRSSGEATFKCPTCSTTFVESQLMVAGIRLDFCPKDRAKLHELASAGVGSGFTEEEIKILGAIRSADLADALVARQVADDVGCYVQKVAKFGEKLDKEGIISRQRNDDLDRYVYFEHPSQ